MGRYLSGSGTREGSYYPSFDWAACNQAGFARSLKNVPPSVDSDRGTEPPSSCEARLPSSHPVRRGGFAGALSYEDYCHRDTTKFWRSPTQAKGHHLCLGTDTTEEKVPGCADGWQRSFCLH
jgi:hypothetical protein